MGFLDLGGLGQITKVLDPGQWIKKGIDSVLPKDMAVVGDLAGAVFDLKTGNLVGAAQLGMDAMKDLPQATKALQQQGQQGAAAGTSSGSAVTNGPAEPSPPPVPLKGIDLSSLREVLKQLTALLNGGSAKPDSTNAGAADTAPADTAPADTPAKPQGTPATTTTSSSDSGGTTTTTTTTTTTSTTNDGTNPHDWLPAGPQIAPTNSATAAAANGAATWVGQPQTPPPAPTSTPPSTPATTTPSTSASAPTPAPTNTATPAASTSSPTPVADQPAATTGSSNGQTITSLAQFNNMSDAAVRDAVIHGRISPELAKDQTAMMAIQQRMNAISEMNNLMTNMMRALHDMQMAVIQNVRV